MSVIYNRLPVLRAEWGLSRQDLAKALGVHYQTVGYLERGEYKPSLSLAFDIAEFFGLRIEEVFSRTPFPPAPVRSGLARTQPPGRDEPGRDEPDRAADVR